MLYLNSIFVNAEQFREKFGTPEERVNKIGLATLKSRWFRSTRLFDAAFYGRTIERVPAPGAVYAAMLDMANNSDGCIALHGRSFVVRGIRTDCMGGLCEDGDTRSIRYVKRVETREGWEDKVYKMRASKMFRKIIEEAGLNDEFGEALVNYSCEEFQRNWEAYASQHIGDSYELVVDDDFAAIYDSERCVGDFRSCMVDEGREAFYKNSVDAKAASLRKDDGRIVARCIIFTDVTDMGTGRKVRLGERQYATDGDETLKRMLVARLIDAGKIDGYKRIGAGCGEATAFVGNDGEDWSGKSFRIRCDLESGDTLSYQDSFKFYNYDDGVAYNDCRKSHQYDLDTTESLFLIEESYDEYHDEYCLETFEVHYNERTITCNVDALEDFVYVDELDGWWHVDDVVFCNDLNGYMPKVNAHRCPYCDDWFVTEEYYSELTGEYYDCENCRANAEESWKDTYWYWSDVTDKYYETEAELHEAEAEFNENEKIA